MAHDDDAYDVGYKKPPKSGQFKPGQSGNPKGRAKGLQNVKTDLMQELGETMTITVNGKPVKLTKQRIFLKQITAKAVAGDARASKLLIDLLHRYLSAEPDEVIDVQLPDDDMEILNRYLEKPND